MSGNPSRNTLILCLSITTGVVFLDQCSKYLATRFLDMMHPVSVIPSFFRLTLVHNRGAAFGIMSNLPDPWRAVIFTVVSIGAFALLVHIYSTRTSPGPGIPVTVAMIAGGALGNILDRIRLGYVVDFLDFSIGSYIWPTFNLADSFISVGVGLLMIFLLKEERR